MASTTTTSRPSRAARWLVGASLWIATADAAGPPRLEPSSTDAASWLGTALGTVRVRADRLTTGRDGLLAVGATLEIEAATVEAARVAVGPDGAIEAWEGRWIGPSASATFERLRVGPDGDRIELFGAELRPCACDGPEPWGLRAARVEIVERGVRARGGQILVFGRPLVPVPPLSIPTVRRSGLLPPEVQGGQDGAVLAAPAYLTLGRSADLTLTPELRTRRGGRLSTEGRYALPTGGGSATIDLATDAIRGDPRAAARLDHAQASAHRRLAASLALTSDPFFWQDYEPTRLARLLPATTSRALAGARGVEISAFGAASGPRDGVAVGHAIVGQPWTALPHGLLGRAMGGLTTIGRLTDGAPTADGLAVFEGGLERPTWLGPVRWTPAIDTQAAANLRPGGDGSASARAILSTGLSSELALPIWAAGDRGLTRIEPHVSARLAAGEAVRGIGLILPEPSQAAAGLRARRTVPGAGVVEVLGQAAWTLDGPTPVATARVEGRSGRLQGVWRPAGTDPFTWIDLDVDPGPAAARGRLVHRPIPTGDQLLAGGDLVARPWTLEVGLGLDADLSTRALLGRRAWLGWTHPTGCIGLALWARLDEDRAAPDVALMISAKPRFATEP